MDALSALPSIPEYLVGVILVRLDKNEQATVELDLGC